MLRKGESEDGSATRESLRRGAVMDIVRREQCQRNVMMLEIVPVEEVVAECAWIFQRAEARGEIRAILKRFECDSE